MMFVFSSLDTLSSARGVARAAVRRCAAHTVWRVLVQRSRAAARASGRARCSSSVSASSLDVFFPGPALPLEPAATGRKRTRSESAPRNASHSRRATPPRKPRQERGADARARTHSRLPQRRRRKVTEHQLPRARPFGLAAPPWLARARTFLHRRHLRPRSPRLRVRPRASTPRTDCCCRRRNAPRLRPSPWCLPSASSC